MDIRFCTALLFSAILSIPNLTGLQSTTYGFVQPPISIFSPAGMRALSPHGSRAFSSNKLKQRHSIQRAKETYRRRNPLREILAAIEADDGEPVKGWIDEGLSLDEMYSHHSLNESLIFWALGKPVYYLRWGTFLHWAAFYDSYKCAKILINHGAVIDAKNELGVTPLQVAAYYDSTAVAELLIRNGARLESRDNLGRTPICNSCRTIQYNVTELLLSLGADVKVECGYFSNPLESTCCSGRSKLIKLLIENGAEVNRQRMSFYGPPLCSAAACGNIEVMQTLFKYGAEVNIRNALSRNTPLWLAAAWGYTDAVRVLMDHGADPALRGAANQLPRDVICLYSECEESTIAEIAAILSSLRLPG